MDCSTPGFPFPHHLPEFAQVHVHWISDAIQPSHLSTLFFFCLQSFPPSRVFSNESAVATEPRFLFFFLICVCPVCGLLTHRNLGRNLGCGWLNWGRGRWGYRPIPNFLKAKAPNVIKCQTFMKTVKLFKLNLLWNTNYSPAYCMMR